MVVSSDKVGGLVEGEGQQARREIQEATCPSSSHTSDRGVPVRGKGG